MKDADLGPPSLPRIGLADAAAGGHSVHGLLGWERSEIVALFEQQG